MGTPLGGTWSYSLGSAAPCWPPLVTHIARLRVVRSVSQQEGDGPEISITLLHRLVHLLAAGHHRVEVGGDGGGVGRRPGGREAVL